MPAKPGRKLERKANVTVTLPLALLDRIEDLVEQGKVPSRSRLVLDAVERYIKTL
jgi:metal-responsive CopG/Arc/MetJ family transcriptional regulator